MIDSEWTIYTPSNYRKIIFPLDFGYIIFSWLSHNDLVVLVVSDKTSTTYYIDGLVFLVDLEFDDTSKTTDPDVQLVAKSTSSETLTHPQAVKIIC